MTVFGISHAQHHQNRDCHRCCLPSPPLEADACCAGKLLTTFGPGWRVEVFEVPPSMDMLASPLQPFLFAIKRTSLAASNGSATSSQHAEPICHQLQECPTSVNAEQLADIIQVIHVLHACCIICGYRCTWICTVG